jgi:hypothetical protein
MASRAPLEPCCGPVHFYIKETSMIFLKAIMEYLNEESGAISAIATATYALATLALIFWTVRYVRLTRSLAASSSEQVRHMIREQEIKREASRQGLHELAKIVLIILNQLPATQNRLAEMAGVTLWTEADLLDMRHLARDLDGTAIGNVSWTIYHLNSIGEEVGKLQESLHRNGKLPDSFPRDVFHGTVVQAKKELGHLLEQL